MSIKKPLFFIFLIGFDLSLSAGQLTNTKSQVGMKGDKGDQGEPGKQGICNKKVIDDALKNFTARMENITRYLKNQISDLTAKIHTLENRPFSFGKPLGMNSYAIKDVQLSASSVYKHNTLGYGAHRARLNYKDWNGWASRIIDTNQWLQVVFNRPTIVTAVATQGYKTHLEYVRTYQLNFSIDGHSWKLYTENGIAVKNFTGNADSDTVVKHLLMHPIQCLYLRILPKTWFRHISMRMEVYGF